MEPTVGLICRIRLPYTATSSVSKWLLLESQDWLPWYPFFLTQIKWCLSAKGNSKRILKEPLQDKLPVVTECVSPQ